jgi:hypothetical protein
MMDYMLVNNIFPTIIDRDLWLEGYMSWNMDIRNTLERLVRRDMSS